MTGSNHTKPMCKTIRLSKNKLDNSAHWYFINTQERRAVLLNIVNKPFHPAIPCSPTTLHAPSSLTLLIQKLSLAIPGIFSAQHMPKLPTLCLWLWSHSRRSFFFPATAGATSRRESWVLTWLQPPKKKSQVPAFLLPSSRQKTKWPCSSHFVCWEWEGEGKGGEMQAGKDGEGRGREKGGSGFNRNCNTWQRCLVASCLPPAADWAALSSPVARSTWRDRRGLGLWAHPNHLRSNCLSWKDLRNVLGLVGTSFPAGSSPTIASTEAFVLW